MGSGVLSARHQIKCLSATCPSDKGLGQLHGNGRHDLTFLRRLPIALITCLLKLPQELDRAGVAARRQGLQPAGRIHSDRTQQVA